MPPDTFQSIALVDVVKSANWSYVSTVYSEGSYGEYGIEVFTREATERNVCIAVAAKVPSAADDRVFDDIIQRLSKKPNARAVILFTRAEDARGILEAARRSNMTASSQPFQWLASDGWGRQIKLVEGLEEEAEGAITVELQSENIPGFDEYMASLTPDSNRRNPWFSEYWEEVFGCVLKKNIRLVGNQNSTMCSLKLRLTSETGYEQESKVQFVVDAVYAFALALHNLQRDVCTKTSGLCAAMANYDRALFYRNYLLNVSFTGEFWITYSDAQKLRRTQTASKGGIRYFARPSVTASGFPMRYNILLYLRIVHVLYIYYAFIPHPLWFSGSPLIPYSGIRVLNFSPCNKASNKRAIRARLYNAKPIISTTPVNNKRGRTNIFTAAWFCEPIWNFSDLDGSWQPALRTMDNSRIIGAFCAWLNFIGYFPGNIAAFARETAKVLWLPVFRQSDRDLWFLYYMNWHKNNKNRFGFNPWIIMTESFYSYTSTFISIRISAITIQIINNM